MGEAIVKVNKSTKAILEAGKSLFWKYGVKRVTVEEICQEAEISKMTFYRYFSNKIELLSHIMKGEIEGDRQGYRDIMEKDIDYAEKVRKLIAFKHNQSKKVSVEIFKDIFSGDEEFEQLRLYIEKFQQDFLLELRADFTAAQHCGDLRSDIRIDLMIYMLNVMNTQLSDPNLIGMYDEVSDLSDELTTLFFYGILSP